MMENLITYFATHPMADLFVIMLVGFVLRIAVERGYGGRGLWYVIYPCGERSIAMTEQEAKRNAMHYEGEAFPIRHIKTGWFR